MKTELVDERWFINVYYNYITTILNDQETWGNLDSEELKIINAAMALDRESVTLVELFLLDPVFAPHILTQECSNCKKKSYNMVRANSRSCVFFLCKDCCHDLFMKPFDGQGNNGN